MKAKGFNITKFIAGLKKGNGAVILLVFGVVLLIIVNMDFTKKPAKPATEKNQNVDEFLQIKEKRLKEVLSKIDGVGNVDVMLCAGASEETEYAKEVKENSAKVTEKDKTDIKTEYEHKYTIINQSGGGESPLVIKKFEPQITGAVVVCDGGESQQTRAKIIETVSVLLGVPTNRISVTKRA